METALYRMHPSSITRMRARTTTDIWFCLCLARFGEAGPDGRCVDEQA
jgi:hypothetical protein